jgi:hypothetical protein
MTRRIGNRVASALPSFGNIVSRTVLSTDVMGREAPAPEHEALDEPLTDDGAAGRAERKANRDFLLPAAPPSSRLATFAHAINGTRPTMPSAPESAS